jgi:hypothetical protein
MRTAPTGFQCAVVAFACAVATALISSPQNLPHSVAARVSEAVDGVARGLLMIWKEPTDALDEAEDSPAAEPQVPGPPLQAGPPQGMAG